MVECVEEIKVVTYKYTDNDTMESHKADMLKHEYKIEKIDGLMITYSIKRL